MNALTRKCIELCDSFENILSNPPTLEEYPAWISMLLALLQQCELLYSEVENYKHLLVVPTASKEDIPNILLRTRLNTEIQENDEDKIASIKGLRILAYKCMKYVDSISNQSKGTQKQFLDIDDTFVRKYYLGISK